MTKEEFIDKIGVANKLMDNLQNTLNRVSQTKMEAMSIYIGEHADFKEEQRVKVYRNIDTKTHENKELLGFGYVVGAMVDEDYGIIVYAIKKENPQTKERTGENFFSEAASSFDDFEYCSMLIEKP